MTEVLPEALWAGSALAALRTVLGPSAREVAEAMRRATAYRLRNVGRVAENAQSKLVADSQGSASTVPPRVALRLLDEGSYSDDETVIEYLGGVLASSHTPHGRDDRGTYWTSIVSRLSSYQLRSHYILYVSMRSELTGRGLNIYSWSSLDAIFVPYTLYDIAMEYSLGEWPQAHELFSHSLYGLDTDDLIKFLAAGTKEHLAEKYPHFNFDEGGMLVSPTPAGVELFLWAHGLGSLATTAYTDKNVELSLELDVVVPAGARLISLVERPSKPVEGSGSDS